MLRIKNGKLFLNGRIIEKDLFADGEYLSSKPAEPDETIDAKGMLVLPGLIDSHVHLREPGQEYKEDFYTGSRAAVAGGVTSVIDMPNNKFPTFTEQRLMEKIELSKKALCNVYFHFGASPGGNFEDVRKAEKHDRVKGLKLYMEKTTGNFIINDKKTIERHFENFTRQKPLVVHTEGENVEYTVNLAKKYGSRIHIAHASVKQDVVAAKNYPNGTVEVTPHHLLLTRKESEKIGLVKPPLRTNPDRMELWAILDKVDCVATDHAPHTMEEKKGGAFGFAGLETSLALMIDQYHRKNLSLDWVVSRMSSNPARIFGLEKQGEIKEGCYANLAFVDLKEEWTVRQEELETKCKISPYDGRKLKGKVKKVVFRGKLIYNDGEFLG